MFVPTTKLRWQILFIFLLRLAFRVQPLLLDRCTMQRQWLILLLYMMYLVFQIQCLLCMYKNICSHHQAKLAETSMVFGNFFGLLNFRLANQDVFRG